MFKCCSLYSGSTGNSFFIQTENTKILIDAGVSCKKIETKTYLKNIDRNIVIDSSLLTNTNTNYNHDTLFYNLSKSKMERATKKAVNNAEIFLNETKYNNSIISENQRFITRHSVEWYKKFTLSFACIIFFFIICDDMSPLG